MPALLKLQLAYPGINIDLVLSDRVTDPVTEGVDISLRLGEAGEGYYVARRWGKLSGCWWPLPNICSVMICPVHRVSSPDMRLLVFRACL